MNRKTRQPLRNKGSNEWRYGDSNPGPLACHASALPAELYPQRNNDVTSSGLTIRNLSECSEIASASFRYEQSR